MERDYPGYLDSFALGALVAHQRRWPSAASDGVSRFRVPIIVACWVLAVLRRKAPPEWHLVCLDPLLLAVAYASVLSLAADRIRGPIGFVLDRPALRYLGKISYGVYVVHNFAPIPIKAFLSRFPGWHVIPRIQLLLMALWTLALAALSWHLFEAPINELKKHFPYSRRPRVAVSRPRGGRRTHLPSTASGIALLGCATGGRSGGYDAALAPWGAPTRARADCDGVSGKMRASERSRSSASARSVVRPSRRASHSTGERTSSNKLIKRSRETSTTAGAAWATYCAETGAPVSGYSPASCTEARELMRSRSTARSVCSWRQSGLLSADGSRPPDASHGALAAGCSFTTP